jgi:hypothetical protein
MEGHIATVTVALASYSGSREREGPGAREGDFKTSAAPGKHCGPPGDNVRNERLDEYSEDKFLATNKLLIPRTIFFVEDK